MRIFLLIGVIFASTISFAKYSPEEHYAWIFERQEMLHKTYNTVYINLTDVNKREALTAWYRLYLKEGEAATKTFNKTARRAKFYVQGSDYVKLLYYYTVTGQIDQAAQTYALYALSAHTLVDNFLNDPFSQQWDRSTYSIVSHFHLAMTRYHIRDLQKCFTSHFDKEDRNRKDFLPQTRAPKLVQALKDCSNENDWMKSLNAQLRTLFQPMGPGSKKYFGAPFPVSFAGFVPGNEVDLHNQIPFAWRDIRNIGEQRHLIVNAPAPGMEKSYSELSVEEFKQLMPTPEAAINDLFTSNEGSVYYNGEPQYLNQDNLQWRKLRLSENVDAITKVVRLQNTVDVEDLKTIGYINEVENDEDIKNHPLNAYSTLGHPSFGRYSSSERLGTFGQMIQSIRDAKESVFIDLFWMGGSLGMNLAKELFKKVVEDPKFTVVIVTDNRNKFGYAQELDMVYNYMRAFSEKFTHLNFYITPAHIDKKRTALPEFVDLVVTDDLRDQAQTNSALMAKLESSGFQLLAKSDHTKAMVMDGKDPVNGVAYVGSKNWTDSSGGANFDEVAEVKGPAAAVILDSFYYDAFEAFLLDLRDTNDNRGGEMVAAHIEQKYPDDKAHKAVKKLLAAIDVVDRYTGKENYNVSYQPKEANDVVAPAQNNMYGTEASAVEQYIQAIMSAKRQIIVDDQFLYDPKVVEALKVAKIQNGVDVYVILESLSAVDGSGNHIPNILYVAELASYGIQTKWQITPENMRTAMREDTAIHPDQEIGATFHIKSLTVDGILAKDWETCQSSESEPEFSVKNNATTLITGSANKDVMTMTGGFREYQVSVYSKKAVAEHDCLFWARWHDDDSTQLSDGRDFEIPEQVRSLGIEDQETFLNILRQVFMSPYDFTKDFQ